MSECTLITARHEVTGGRVCEIWLDGKLAGVIYPADGGVRIISKHGVRATVLRFDAIEIRIGEDPPRPTVEDIIAEPSKRKAAKLTARAVEPIVDRIRPELAGQAPELVGAVLAELVSLLVAGHIIPGDRGATDRLREELIAGFIRTVRGLVEVNHKILHGGEDVPSEH